MAFNFIFRFGFRFFSSIDGVRHQSWQWTIACCTCRYRAYKANIPNSLNTPQNWWHWLCDIFHIHFIKLLHALIAYLLLIMWLFLTLPFPSPFAPRASFKSDLTVHCVLTTSTHLAVPIRWEFQSLLGLLVTVSPLPIQFLSFFCIIPPFVPCFSWLFSFSFFGSRQSAIASLYSNSIPSHHQKSHIQQTHIHTYPFHQKSLMNNLLSFCVLFCALRYAILVLVREYRIYQQYIQYNIHFSVGMAYYHIYSDIISAVWIVCYKINCVTCCWFMFVFYVIENICAHILTDER